MTSALGKKNCITLFAYTGATGSSRLPVHHFLYIISTKCMNEIHDAFLERNQSKQPVCTVLLHYFGLSPTKHHHRSEIHNASLEKVQSKQPVYTSSLFWSVPNKTSSSLIISKHVRKESKDTSDRVRDVTAGILHKVRHSQFLRQSLQMLTCPPHMRFDAIHHTVDLFAHADIVNELLQGTFIPDRSSGGIADGRFDEGVLDGVYDIVVKCVFYIVHSDLAYCEYNG
mmetsp:Transcript_7975/g.12659  ORF Transcript_7975/g.12659 Transcript_7975/m.12659 type:complete len:227 (-) Transcript_7975:89-769(-)